jgi:hypothetical protein
MDSTLMKTKAAMCCVAMSVQPDDATGQKRRFWHVRSTSGGIIRTAEQALLLHDGIALTFAPSP